MTTKTTKPATKAIKKPEAVVPMAAVKATAAAAPKAAVKATAAPKVVVKAAAAPKVAMNTTGTVTVKQTGSPLRRERKQRLHLLSLGLGKMNRIKTLKDSPSVRGLIYKVQHMVTVLS
jgi:large subunit ribosomal protein L30